MRVATGLLQRNAEFRIREILEYQTGEDFRCA